MYFFRILSYEVYFEGWFHLDWQLFSFRAWKTIPCSPNLWSLCWKIHDYSDTFAFIELLSIFLLQLFFLLLNFWNFIMTCCGVGLSAVSVCGLLYLNSFPRFGKFLHSLTDKILCSLIHLLIFLFPYNSGVSQQLIDPVCMVLCHFQRTTECVSPHYLAFYFWSSVSCWSNVLCVLPVKFPYLEFLLAFFS